MAKCKSCDKKGLFLKVSKVGLCKDCDPRVTEDITTHSNVIYEEMHVFERAVETPEKLEALDKILAAAKHLVAYEDKGLETCSPPAKLVLDEYTGFKNDLAKS
ncbi:MAG: hypothetical protein DHS20C15_25930 [Planctomycetota bacterium]|nr:MAG: hypothetical protein DHS20C15_25930 [Planctomycetota bacterium]